QMNYDVLLHPKADDFLQKVDDKIETRIKEKMKSLSSDPNKGKKLKYSDFWRLRIGEYKAIYEIDNKDEKIVILFIGNRKDVYDDFSRLV
ncbi:MAG: type II toxin-antitoxin system RelE family toxin, partial [Thermoplasmatota archaeon]